MNVFMFDCITKYIYIYSIESMVPKLHIERQGASLGRLMAHYGRNVNLCKRGSTVADITNETGALLRPTSHLNKERQHSMSQETDFSLDTRVLSDKYPTITISRFVRTHKVFFFQKLVRFPAKKIR